MTGKAIPLVERFWAKVDKRGPEECWEWTAALKENGYGQIASDKMYKGGFPQQAHRVSYEIHYGPIPGELVVDHMCFNRKCVNPHHLQLLTFMENCRRQKPRPPKKLRTHCKKGHNLEYLSDERRRRRSCPDCSFERALLRFWERHEPTPIL